MRLIAALLAAAIVAPLSSSLAGEPPAHAAPLPKIEQALKQLGSSNFSDRQRASTALVSYGAAALPQLRVAARGADPEVARRAKECIAEIARNDQLGYLTAELSNPDRKAAAAAASRLAELGPSAKPALAALVKALDDSDSDLRCGALAAISHLGPEAKAAIPKVIALMTNEKAGDNVHWVAGMCLRGLGSVAEETAPDLIRALTAKDASIRNGAACALGVVGKNSSGAITALIKALGDARMEVRGNAARALSEIAKEPKRCIPALVEALNRERNLKGNQFPSEMLLLAISRFGEEAKEAVPTVYVLAADENEPAATRTKAVQILAHLGPEGRKKLQMLAEGPSSVSEIARNALRRAAP